MSNKALSSLPAGVSILSSDYLYGVLSGNSRRITVAELGVAVGLPATTTDNAIARFDGTTGALQNSGVTIDDSNNLTVPGSILSPLAGLSVFGVTGNATANMAAITAGSDNQIMRRSGTSIGFGSIDLSQSNAVGSSRLGLANIAQGSARSVLGVTGNATADYASIQGTADQVLVINGAGTALAFGTVATGGITNDAVTNAKLANVATATFKGRTTAGTGDPEDLTATQATALLNAVIGDSGSGGTKGLVPAPGAGDAAAGKFLKADGTFAVSGTSYFPSAFTSTAIQAAIDLAAAAGGGTVQLLDGDYAMSAAALISTDDIWLVASPNTRLLAPASATSIDGLITVQVTGLGTDTTLGSNAAIGDRSITLTTDANIAVGDYVRLTVTKVTTGYFYSLITKCLTKPGGNVITIADPLPFIMLTTDTSTSIRKIPMLSNVKLKGLRCFGNGNSGTTRGILAQRLAVSAIDDCSFNGFHNAAGLYFDDGYNNRLDHIDAFDCGNANESDITIRSQTNTAVGEIRSNQASGFGPQFQSVNYCTVQSVISDKASNRGIKLNSSVFCQYGMLIGNNSGSTGVAVTLGSTDNSIDSVIAMSNRGGSGNDIGLWFSAQDNARNHVGSVNTKNNLDWDIDIGATDIDNHLADAIYTTKRDLGTRNLVGRITDAFITGGYAVAVNANATGDTAIAIKSPTENYRISSVVIQNVGTTASLTTAQFGIFTATGGGGTAISAAGQVLSALTSNTTGANGAFLNHVPATTPTACWTMTANSTLYFRITTAQGAAATLRVYFIIHPVPTL